MYSIYRIYCLETDLCYIGKTNDTSRRWSAHRRTLRNGNHHSYKLQAAFVAHGEEAFEYEVVEPFVSEKNVYNREAYWIKKYDSYRNGYNVRYVSMDEHGQVDFTEEVDAVTDNPNLEQFKKELQEQMRIAFEGQISDMRDEIIKLQAVSELLDEQSRGHFENEAVCHEVIAVMIYEFEKNNIPVPKLKHLSEEARKRLERIHNHAF